MGEPDRPVGRARRSPAATAGDEGRRRVRIGAPQRLERRLGRNGGQQERRARRRRERADPRLDEGARRLGDRQALPGVSDVRRSPRAPGRSRGRRTDCRRTPPRSGRARGAGTIGRTAPGTAGGGPPAASARGEAARAAPPERPRSARGSARSAPRGRPAGRPRAGRPGVGSRRPGWTSSRRRATARRRSPAPGALVVARSRRRLAVATDSVR